MEQCAVCGNEGAECLCLLCETPLCDEHAGEWDGYCEICKDERGQETFGGGGFSAKKEERA